MVSQALKLSGDLIVLVQDGNVVRQLQVRQKFHGIFADGVRHAVDLVLLRQDLLINSLVEVFQQTEGLLHIGPCG